MSKLLNICLIHGRPVLVEYFRSLGHVVLELSPQGALFNLPAALAKAHFVPDMVLQVERLSSRTLVSGLGEVDCPKAFWSIDTHLNLFWQRWYGQLFDVVLTTQRAWIGRLERAGIGCAKWLPWYGMHRSMVPHQHRKQDIAFVGRITSHRPARLWFANFLREEYGVEPVENLTFGQMMDYYSTSRLVPNETIFGEVNFRLFEAASSGCAVFNPNVSDELMDLFEPGVEIELFDHVLDLKLLLDRHVKDPARSMKMGLAASKRVQAEHLATHRAERILDIVPNAPRKAVQGKAARKVFSLSIFALWEAGRLGFAEGDLLGLLEEFGDDHDVLGARIRALTLLDRQHELSDLMDDILRAGGAGDLRLDAVCSAACLWLDRWDVAKLFWYRYMESLGEKTAPKPDTPAQLLRFWARELQRAGEIMRAGFVLHEREHLPTSAAECLLVALEGDREDLSTYTRLEQLMANIYGVEPLRMGLLSHLALHDPDNWRTGLDLALTHLQAFRMSEGLAELISANDKAERKGELQQFLRILKVRDSGGLLVAALAK